MQVFRFVPEALDALIGALRARGYQVVGPTPRDGAIVYDEIESARQLPIGQSDQQEKGLYRLVPNQTNSYFAYNVGPYSWKKFLFPNNHLLWRSQSENGQLKIQTGDQAGKPYAFLGVRPCELKAIAVQDKVFMEGTYPDKAYKDRRKDAFLVAVNCTQAGKTCFCTSMGGSPRASDGYQLALTEVLGEDEHYFVAEAATTLAEELMQEIGATESCRDDLAVVGSLTNDAVENMGRQVNTDGLADLLEAQRNHPHWKDVGSRCLNCTNCTMVCPTCFCFSVEDHASLSGDTAERRRNWDSCFNLSFSYQHGGAVRRSASSRYRQWLTHKFSAWHDQFGESGCVGCGRCVTWCPVGIDLTEEVRVFQEDAK